MPLLLVSPAECWNLLEMIYQLAWIALGLVKALKKINSRDEEEYHLDSFPFFMLTLTEEQEIEEDDEEDDTEENWETIGSSVELMEEDEDDEEEEYPRKNLDMYSFKYHTVGDNSVVERLLVDNQKYLEKKEEHILENLLNLQRNTLMIPHGCNYRSLVRTELYNMKFGL